MIGPEKSPSRQVSAAHLGVSRPNRFDCEFVQRLENGIPNDRKTDRAALVRRIRPPVPVRIEGAVVKINDVHRRNTYDCGRKEIEAVLKAALAKEEPESVPQIARRLAYAGSAPFFDPFPRFCRAINLKIARHKAARPSDATNCRESRQTESPAYFALAGSSPEVQR